MQKGLTIYAALLFGLGMGIRPQYGLAETVEFVWQGKDADVAGSKSKTIRRRLPMGKGEALVARKGAARPTARIVLAANPTRSAQIAAAELQHYVEKITGERLGVMTDEGRPCKEGRILIGESALTRSLGLRSNDFDEQEYLIRTYGDLLVLMGRDEAEYGLIHYDRRDLWDRLGQAYDWSLKPERSKLLGSVYAVHTFLQDHCGVRWYLPGDLGEECPRRDRIVARDLDVRRKPWSKYRWVGMHWWRPDYLAVGGWTIRDIFLWQLRMKLFGIEAYSCNHSLVPAWFEKRTSKKEDILAKGYEKPTQLCLNSDELFRMVCQDADDYFAGKANWARACGDYFPVMPHDTSHYCKCEECQSQVKPEGEAKPGWWTDRASNYVWRLVNRVAKHVKQKHRGKWVGCCSYARYTFFPDAPDLRRLADNVFVMTCRALPGAVRRPDYAALSNEVIEDWAKRVGRWYVWEYFSHIQSQNWPARFPMVFTRAIQRDMKHLHALGCRGVFNEYESYLRDCALSHLNVYVHLQLLNDIDYDVAQGIEEYCTLFYGPAAEPMKQFLSLMEERCTDPKHYAPVRPDAQRPLHDVSSWERVCPPSVLNRLGEIMEQARKAARGSGMHERRVEWMHNRVYRMMVRNCHRHSYGHIKEPQALTSVPLEASPEKAFEITGDNPGYILWPSCIHIDRDDNIFVGEHVAGQVLKFSTDGDVLMRIPIPGNYVAAVTTDRFGKIYVIGSNGVLHKFHADGAACSDFLDKTTHEVRGLYKASGLVVMDDGRLIIAFEREKQIRRYDADAVLDESFGEGGVLKLGFRPSRITFTNGRLYCLDPDGNRVCALDGTASFQPTDGVALTRTLYAAQGQLYVGTTKPHGVLVLGHDLRPVRRFKTPGPFARVVAADSRGRVWVGNDRGGLFAYGSDGPDCIGGGSSEDGRFAAPSDLALDGRGNLIVCEIRTDRVQTLEAGTHRFLGKFHTGLTYNSALAVDADRNVYVGNLAYNNVSKFDPDGRRVWRKGKAGKGVGEFSQIMDLAIDGNGHLCVAEGGGARVQAFDRDLEPAALFGGKNAVPCTRTTKARQTAPSPCAGIALDADGFLYASQARGPGVVRMKPDGTPLRRFYHWGRLQTHLGERCLDPDPPPYAFRSPGAVVVDASGDIYVADTELGCIKKFDRRGTYLGSFGSVGYGPGQFRYPCGLLLDARGNLYVCDRGNSRIYKLVIERVFSP